MNILISLYKCWGFSGARYFHFFTTWVGCWGEYSARLLMCSFSDLNTPFVSTASPNNPAVHGDPGEPALHCWIRPAYPGCVPAVLCPTGLRVLFPFMSRFFLKSHLSYFRWFECLLSCSSFHFLKETEGRQWRIWQWLPVITPKKQILPNDMWRSMTIGCIIIYVTDTTFLIDIFSP